MIGFKSTVWFIFCGVFVFVFSLSSFAGLADKYPGDIGIESDPNVVFVENFEEGSIPAVTARWETVQKPDIMSLDTDTPSASSGENSILLAHVESDASGYLYRRLLPGYDKLYVRFYVKFAPDCHPIHHFATLGGYIPSTPWPMGGAGDRPVGDDRLTTGIEPMGSSWRWDYYSYWMEMRSWQTPQGVPDGRDNPYYGNTFIRDNNWAVVRGEWICVELMMKMNSPTTSHNGEQAVWVNGQPWYKGGQLVSHLGEGFPNGYWANDKWYPNLGSGPFEGFRWRSTQALNLNFLWLQSYIDTVAGSGHINNVWFDDIVVATEYIGPLNDIHCDFDDANFADYAVLASHWADDTCVGPEWCDCADNDRSGTVDFGDLGQFGQYWQQARGVFHESGGSVDFEVEYYAGKDDGSGAAAGASWTELIGNGSSGDGYVRALPDSGLTIDTNIETESPHLSYEIEFATPGTYYLWLKGWSEDPWSQYIHYGLDGSAISTSYAEAPLLSHDGAFTWKSSIFGGSRPTLVIESAGRRTLDIWMREDGAKIDRILLTTDAGFVPSN